MKIRHSLLFGGGWGFVSGAGTDIRLHLYGGENTVAEITTKYHFNALPGYKCRLQPSDFRKLFPFGTV
jgi:hypothetical protein